MRPYQVIDVCTENILDLKVLSQSIGILQVRVCEESKAVKWPDIMKLRISKKCQDTIQFKMSHQEETFQTSRLSQRRTSITPLDNAYGDNGLVISSAKYEELMSLCSGSHPVIREFVQR